MNTRAAKGEDYPATIDLVARGVLKLEPLVTHVVPLLDLEKAIGMLESDEDQRMKIILENTRLMARRNEISCRADWNRSANSDTVRTGDLPDISSRYSGLFGALGFWPATFRVARSGGQPLKFAQSHASRQTFVPTKPDLLKREDQDHLGPSSGKQQAGHGGIALQARAASPSRCIACCWFPTS